MLPFWFERRLGMVEGIRQLGMAGAMLFIPAINLALITSWGWRGAYAILGGAVWCTLFPLFFYLFRNRPEDVGQRMDGDATIAGDEEEPAADAAWWGLTLEEAVRTFSFWVVTAGIAMFALIHTAVFFCLVPIFQERGLSSQEAAAAMTAFAACRLRSRPVAVVCRFERSGRRRLSGVFRRHGRHGRLGNRGSGSSARRLLRCFAAPLGTLLRPAPHG